MAGIKGVIGVLRLIFNSGAHLDVDKDEGRYYVCGKRRVRKSNPEIKRVEEVKEKTESDKKD